MQGMQRKPLFARALVTGALAVTTTFSGFSGCMPCNEKLAALSEQVAELRGPGNLNDRIEKLVSSLKDDCPPVRTYAANELVRIGRPATNALVEMLEDRGQHAEEAIKVLGKIKDERAIPALAESLGEIGLMERAKEALRGMGAPAIPGLIGQLKNPNHNIRYYISDILGDIGDTRAVPALTEAVEDKDEYVRNSAARSLGLIAGRHYDYDWSTAVKALTAAYKNGRLDSTWFQNSLSSMGKYAIPALMDLLNNSGYRMMTALEALKDTALKHPDCDWAPVIPALFQVLEYEHGREWYLTKMASDAIAAIGDPVVPRLIELVREDKNLRYKAEDTLKKLKDVKSIPLLKKALKDAESRVRAAAAGALGSIGHASSVPQLVEAMSDESSTVREIATRALGETGDVSAIAPLLVALENRELGMGAAGALRDIAAKNPGHEELSVAVLPLIRALNREWGTKLHAAEALGNIGDKRALPELKRIAETDGDVFVKSAAEQAIRKISK